MLKRIIMLLLLVASIIKADIPKIEITSYYTPKAITFPAIELDSLDLLDYNNHYIDLSEIGVYCIVSKFKYNKNDSISNPSLFVSPSSYSIIVTLNNLEIYRWGAFDNPISMTNFGASTIVLTNIKEGDNYLKLYIYSDGKNLPLPKFYISDYESVARASSFQTLFNLYLIQAIGIIALFSSIIFLSYSAASKFKEYDVLYFSIFAFSIFMGYIHFIANSPVSNDLLWFKVSRIGYVIAAMSLFLFSCSYSSSFNNRLIKKILFIIDIGIIVHFSISKSQIALNSLFSLYSLLFILPLLFWGYALLVKALLKRGDASIKFIVAGYTLFLLATIHDISCVLRNIEPYFWITPYGYFSLISTIIFALVLRYYNSISERIKAEKLLIESEEKYRQVYNAPNDGIFIQDPYTLEIYDSNKAAREMLGYDESEMKHLQISDISLNESPYTLDEAKMYAEKALEKDDIVNFDWRAKKKNGELLWVEVHLKKTVIAGNLRILTFFRDVTQRNRLEESLRQSHKMEAIGTLAGGIAHDFNNILSGIIGFTEYVMMETKDNNSIKNELGEIIKASERARELVQQILTFSRKSPKRKSTVVLKSIVEESVKLLRSSIPSNIDFKLNLNCDSLIDADATQIHQVIMNICTNSYHAMQENGGTLFIDLNPVEIKKNDIMIGAKLHEGTYVKLTISDTGYGIPKDVVKRIFDPYFTTKKDGKGTGLGLSVVHGIIKDHNGEISVYSELDKGTTFHIYFPVVHDAESVKKEVVENSLDDLTGNEHILIADDEKTITSLVSKVFPKYGYKVTTCMSGDEAWEMYKNNDDKYDLIISDMTMPGMTGLELARKILEKDKDFPVIICSGYSKFIDEDIALSEKISAFLYKPLNIKSLLKAVRLALN